MIVVVDASVVVKWYVKEIHDGEAELLLNGGFELHAPELVIPELGNILWKKCRNGQISNDEALKIAEAFGRQDIHFHKQKSLLRSALFGANVTGKTVYDWTYLSLALLLSCPFITADGRFFTALKDTKFRKHLMWIEDVPNFI
jgi:predicted nucleic acid-binding protein